MRVSIIWNELTAPILYQTVQFTYPQYSTNPFSDHKPQGSNPFYVPPKKPWLERARKKVASKEQNIKLIRHISFPNHNHEECKNAVIGRGRTIKVSTIRFDLGLSTSSNGWIGPHWRRQRRTGYLVCKLLDEIKSDTVVFFDTSPMLTRYPTKVDTVVCVFNPPDRAEDGHMYYRSEPENTCRRAIYIYRTSGPNASYYDTTDLGTHSTPRNQSWTKFQQRVNEDAWRSPITKEVIIVNIDSVNKAHEGADRKDLAKVLQYRTNTFGPDDPSSDVEFKLKFLTMAEYLSQYDWEGVFTEEEVAGWLAL